MLEKLSKRRTNRYRKTLENLKNNVFQKLKKITEQVIANFLTSEEVRNASDHQE